ncbi:MAG: O-antigen ligase family protein [Sulfurovum sp.]|nr:O-antigen ligase family protein [Sulfurovum sp.]
MLSPQFRKLDFFKTINYLAIVYAFILPLSRGGIGVITALLVLLWFLEGNFKQKLTLYINTKVVVALLVFLVFNIFSLLWTEDIQGAVHTMRRYAYLLPVFVLMFSLKKEYIFKILSAFILGMFISEVISYGVFFELWQFKHATPANPSPFMHHIEYSIFLAFTALVLMGRIFNEDNLRHKLFYSFFFMTVSGNLFLTAGRTGQLAFILGLFVLAVLSFKNKVKALVIAIVLSTLVLSIAFNLSTTFHDRIITGKDSLVNVVKKENYCTSWGSRVGAWIISKDIIVQDPILGIGNADNMKEFHHLIDTKYPSMVCMHKAFYHAHNQYFQIWTALGLVGLLIFLSIFYIMLKMQIKDKELKNIKYVYLTLLAFGFVSEVLLQRQFSLALFALIFGILLAQYRIENESN